MSNPRIVEFYPSTDHATKLPDGRWAVTKYVFEVYQNGAASPFHTLDIGKPAPQSDGRIRYNFGSTVSAWPLPGGTYQSRVAAVGPLGTSRSTFSNQFTFSTTGSCSYAVTPTSISVGAVASSATVSVTTGTSCTWSLTGLPTWITASKAGAKGTSSVTLTIGPNAAGTSRSANVLFGGKAVTVKQSGVPCHPIVTPTRVAIPRAGSTGLISVKLPAGCSWTATGAASWVSFPGTTRTGSGTVSYSVDRNPVAKSRQAFLFVARTPVLIAQKPIRKLNQSHHAPEFDGDAVEDLAVYRPSTGRWFALSSSTDFATGLAPVGFGAAGDVPVRGDFDGDGLRDLAVYRPSTGTWFWLMSSSADRDMRYRGWGVAAAGDIPVPGDYDGDGKTDPAVYRPRSGTWFILSSSSGYTTSRMLGWGGAGDQPVAGDYDGDRRTDVAIYRPRTGQWFVLPSSAQFRNVWSPMDLGAPGDLPMPADYDGDGRRDVAVYRPSTGTWFWLTSSSNYTSFDYKGWGVQAQGDVPVPGDYDGDGKTDLCVYRKPYGTWYVLWSSTRNTTYAAYGWGTSTDITLGGQR